MNNKTIFAGPCSAETEDQVMQTAEKIADIDKKIIFRSGIWKPRTRPNSFEGVGAVGLSWLMNVQKTYGLRTGVEVANTKHVEEALSNKVSVLWIGARTTVNPFTVQEIADALKGSGVAVYIKNPINPDIQLWIGALERIQNAGIKEIGIIHRGFSSYRKSEFRNVPMWQIPIEMKLKYPNLPLLCDVSHIGGGRANLLSLAQKAADLDFNGLMIETHITPDKAWSDAEQQVTPDELSAILTSIKWKANDRIESIKSSLEKMREEIGSIDNEIFHLISQRMKISENIGVLKKEHNIPVLQAQRWKEIITQSVEKGKKLGLSTDFIQTYLDAIHIESIGKQNEEKKEE